MNNYFKDVPTWEGLYGVAESGTIKNLRTGHILKPFKQQNGYYTVWFAYKGRRQKWSWHVLVATVWIRAPKKGEDVHHINKQRADNRVSNLQIVDHASHNRNHKLGIKKTQEQKRQISETLKKNYQEHPQIKQKIRKAITGITRSKETRQKMSKAAKIRNAIRFNK